MLFRSLSTKLHRYRLVESSIHLGARSAVRGRCLHGWYSDPEGRAVRGSFLRLGDGVSILDRGRLGLTTDGPHTPAGDEALLDLLLAGCSYVLAPRVEAMLQNGVSIHFERAWVGRPALAVRLRSAREALTLDLAPKTDAVIGVAVRFRHLSGWSRIRPLPLTAARLELLAGRR